VTAGLGLQVSTARPPFPYPGLRPFEADEWSIFFGREAMIDELIERLARERLVLVHGASGAGKSSLIRAGVLPKLARQHLRHGTAWLTCAMRPSNGPLWNLASEFARLEGRADDLARIGEIIRLFNRRGARLSQIVDSLEGLAGKRVCVLVDQFEEVFRFERETSREEVELFIDLLISEIPEVADPLLAPDPEAPAPLTAPETAQPLDNLHIIITMRSEFLGECARFDRFAEAINRAQYLVPRLTREGLLRAIRHPARLYAGEVTAGLAERLVADVRGKLDELPLIQHGLMLFWHQRSQQGGDAKIVLDADMLNVAGGLAQLLSDHADRVMRTAAPDGESESAVEKLFRAVTDINAEGQAIRRPQSFRDLLDVCGVSEERLRAILDAFRAEGVSFIAPYAPAPIKENTIVDISHESLIRCWRTVADPQQGWLRREFNDGLVWRSLLFEAKEFEENQSRVLSPAATTERTNWVSHQTKTWSVRYGGGWDLVDRLLLASRAEIRRRRRQSRAVQALIFGLMGVVIIGLVGWINQTYLKDQFYWWGSLRPYAASQFWPHVLTAAQEAQLKPGQTFLECASSTQCPDMVVLPAGNFMMGSPTYESGRSSDEGPQHKVTIDKPFAVSKFEITFDQWDACIAHGGCSAAYDFGWGRGLHPVIDVSWDDAQRYVGWLSEVTGKTYRLITEAEFEYGARAGTTTPYSWGTAIGTDNANCLGCGSGYDGMQTATVGYFPANRFGLFDMSGDVWEWTQDCYHPNYNGAPSDDTAWTANADCSLRVVRGGSWASSPQSLRSAARFKYLAVIKLIYLGFRVARDLGQ
jgi:formylglycine-generating enzyme required for sulfatase activity